MGLDIGLAPNSRQAIIWTSADPIHWRIYAVLGGGGWVGVGGGGGGGGGGGVAFVVSLDKLWDKQPSCRLFETPSRHFNVNVIDMNIAVIYRIFRALHSRQRLMMRLYQHLWARIYWYLAPLSQHCVFVNVLSGTNHWKQEIVNLTTGRTVSCYYDNLRWHHWWQSCQIDNLLFSGMCCINVLMKASISHKVLC